MRMQDRMMNRSLSLMLLAAFTLPCLALTGCRTTAPERQELRQKTRIETRTETRTEDRVDRRRDAIKDEIRD